MKLKTKILSGYSIILSLLGLVIVWALMNIISLGQAADAILRENYRSITAADWMIHSLDAQKSLLLQIILSEDPAPLISDLQKKDADFIQWLARAKDNITIPGESVFVEELDTEYARHRLDLYNYINRFAPADIESDRMFLAFNEILETSFGNLQAICRQLLNINESVMYNAGEQARQLSTRAFISTLSIAVAALLTALFFSFVLAERIVRPIHRFGDASRRISRGDYSVNVFVDTKDELGTLAAEFNRMASQLGKFHELNIEQIVAEKNKADTILSSIEDGLVVFDRDLSVTGINPAARKILNLDNSGKKEIQCETLFQKPDICSLIRKTFAENRTVEIPEEDRILVFPDDNDPPRHFYFTITIIRGQDKPVAGCVLMLRDITRMKELENLKSEFVMAASHELRTPLTSLGMSIDLLKEISAGKYSDKEQDLIDTAREEVLHMKSLTEDLLELSRLESGRIQIENDRVSIKSLFEYITNIFNTQMESRSIHFSSQISGENLFCFGDLNKISWVLSNLISNALRYVPDQGTIGIFAVKIGFNIHISVEDNGPGIPEEYQSRIFQKFSQIKGRKPGGSGLGLAICREVIRAHGGTIWVESRPGKGSIFTFTLPLTS